MAVTVPSADRADTRPRAGGSVQTLLREFPQRLDRPLTSYYLIFGSSALLIALGLVMVLSSSMVDSYTETGSAYSLFQKQMLAAAIGLPLMVVASHLPLSVFRLLGYPAVLGSVALLVLTVFQGQEYYGATRWLEIGGLTIQASEPAKLAFALWGANVLARKDEMRQLLEWRQLLIPVLPGCGVLVILVLLGSDLGTTFVLMAIFLALLWVVGAPGRLFLGMFVLVVALVGIMIAVEPFRMARLMSFLDPEADPTGSGFQLLHGLYALGTGGVFGVGIGGSREKWGFLPHPESDFIFAIIGEELGLIGTLLVVGLFGLLGYAGLRVASRAREPFVRLAAASLTAWIVVQALVNIGTVIGVLPITGIPLPLVSAGGSSLIPTMLALGILLALAKAEPDARKALAARGPSRVQRALSWLGLDNVGAPTTKAARNQATIGSQQARRNRRR
ncbi:putative lipid II flippase FtsW [Marinitenerispora sediminis]|uniref:Probable peptidoglycan glycosyltransferase FtsW n=1 Tax=Marinitenerispora sediminis TaxID=1931232 RepID=A0A368T5K9_9ACTN|nr:putative lipid II flippase FtsW [Marinitenerispora sediminis]RCV54491.1 putative lipid II flippase FtsW [Marinitenerispora sediminis]RCV58924.1 putative lipid II flippase FtsW [Marinitenerispora sediminis]RCV61355.1 putative lipid II flippase FtsW [Marinitenerispora sediminis]